MGVSYVECNRLFKKNFCHPEPGEKKLKPNAGSIFSAIHREHQRNSILPVRELCRLAGVSRSGYYQWVKTTDKRIAREQKDQEDFQKVLEAYRFRGYAKGHRSISLRLARMGYPMNHKKVLRLMKKYNLYCPIRKPNPYRRLAKALKTDVISPNHLKREFRSRGPRKVLLTDITYLRLKDGFCYLSVIKDACTMEVLAYELSESLQVDFVLETVRKLMRNHQIHPDQETILHSDQGCHYTSAAFRRLLNDEGFRQSMSRRGNCWDNAPQESFFGLIKQELEPYIKGWKSFEDVKARINDWMDYYNRDRLQTSLGGMSPNEYYHYLMTGERPAECL